MSARLMLSNLLGVPGCMQVEPQHVHYELSAAKFSWDHPRVYSSASRLTQVTVVKDVYDACKDAHAICLLTGVWRSMLQQPTANILPYHTSLSQHACTPMHTTFVPVSLGCIGDMSQEHPSTSPYATWPGPAQRRCAPLQQGVGQRQGEC